MSAASNYLEAKLLDHTLRYGVAPYVAPTTLYLALFTSAIDSATTSANLEAGTTSTNEVATTGSTAYARAPVTFSAATGTNPTSSATAATVTFDPATASWGTVTHIAVMDGATRGSGNVLFYGTVTVSKTIDSGDTFQVTAGNLTISLA
jgi:hypothetical protein